MLQTELDAIIAECDAQRRPSPLDMPRKRVTPDMLAVRLAWTTVTGDVDTTCE